MAAPVKAYSKKQIADLYDVSVWVIRTWLKPHKEKIGDYRGKCYTPAQVIIIFECLGEPESEYDELKK